MNIYTIEPSILKKFRTMNCRCSFSRLCLSGTLSPELVRGKIVLCLRGYSTNVEKGLEVSRAGGLGFILQNPVDGISISVDAHVLPGTAILSNDSTTVLNYIKSNKNATARIIPVKAVLGSKPSPFMAGFSSTGPNPLEPNILKVYFLYILPRWYTESHEIVYS